MRLLLRFADIKFSWIIKGEELRKMIGAPAYIECSSKTQQACLVFRSFSFFFQEIYSGRIWLSSSLIFRMWNQFLMLQLKLCSSHQSKRRRRGRPKRPAPYCDGHYPLLLLVSPVSLSLAFVSEEVGRSFYVSSESLLIYLWKFQVARLFCNCSDLLTFWVTTL